MARPAEKDKPGGPTIREHYEAAAAAGSEAAQQVLDEQPECPEELEYLVEWSYRLHGRSGSGMGGIAPLSYVNLDAWARLMGYELTATEVDALIDLDAAMCAAHGEDTSKATPGDNNEQQAAAAPPTTATGKIRGQWPDKKRAEQPNPE
jgi:hypothetical protein